MPRTSIRLALALPAAGIVAALATAAAASVIPGTPGPDVHFGYDNDNAANQFIQPPGVPTKQHMDDTDVVFGRDGNDLLAGRLGSDTVVGGTGQDILIGGPEAGSSEPSADVLLGDEGDDIGIWAPGDGNDAYVGDVGNDAMIVAPFVTKASGDLKLERFHGRRIPRVDIGGQSQGSCAIEPIPPSQQFGAQFLVRFYDEPAGEQEPEHMAGTIRLKDVEHVYCVTSTAGKVAVADLSQDEPTFQDVPLSQVGGLVGAIVAAP